MAPRSKRARTSSTSNEDENVAAQADFTSNLKQHESLWFDDGNIVLATDVHLYCVYKGILAKNSSVFRDMLELPNVGGTVGWMGVATGDSWDGKPLVRMVGDSDEDVYHLLMTLYDIRFYSAHQPTTLPVILSLLRMSSKYDFNYIQGQVVKHLAKIYPSDLDAMAARDIDELIKDGGEVDLPSDHDFQLLAGVLQCNDIKILLPMLYFECAVQDLKDILTISERYEIPKQEQEVLIHGHEKLSKYSYEFAFKVFAPHIPCNSTICSIARADLFSKQLEPSDISSPTFSLVDLLENKSASGHIELRASICKACSKTSKTVLANLRSEFWERIPDIFDMKTWDDVKRE